MDDIKVRDLRNGNWYWVHKIVYEQYTKKIGVIGLGIYNALCYYANNDSCCFPSISRLCNMLKLSRPTVVKYLAILEQYRLIKRTSGREGGVTNIYHILKVAGVNEVNRGCKPAYNKGVNEVNTNNNYILTRLREQEIKRTFKKKRYSPEQINDVLKGVLCDT